MVPGPDLEESVRDVVERSLAAARQREDLGAFWALCDGRAVDAAAELDRRRESGERVGTLVGATIAVKDCFDLEGMVTTAGLQGLHTRAPRDAAAVKALERAGAVAVGKTSMDPLAWSTHGEAPGHPPCLNPRDTALSPGGSSSGSAAAVAAGIASLGLGTDLAGSVRIPAAYCGIVGLKPALRAVSLRGCLPIAPTFHVPGVMARSVAECRTAYEALVGKPVGEPEGDVRVAVLEDLMEGADGEVAGACERALAGAAGAAAGGPALGLGAMRLDWTAHGFGRILAFELARDWGRRIESEPERYPPQIHESVELGREVPGDVYRETLLEIRRAQHRLARRLDDVAVVACPTVPVPVPARARETVGESIRYTRLFSALGWPAVSVPCGPDSAGRPVGLQLAAPPARLPELLAASEAVERASGASLPNERDFPL